MKKCGVCVSHLQAIYALAHHEILLFGEIAIHIPRGTFGMIVAHDTIVHDDGDVTLLSVIQR